MALDPSVNYTDKDWFAIAAAQDLAYNGVPGSMINGVGYYRDPWEIMLNYTGPLYSPDPGRPGVWGLSGGGSVAAVQGTGQVIIQEGQRSVPGIPDFSGVSEPNLQSPVPDDLWTLQGSVPTGYQVGPLTGLAVATTTATGDGGNRTQALLLLLLGLAGVWWLFLRKKGEED